MTIPGPVGLLFLLFFLVLVPWGAYRSRAVLEHTPGLPRVAYFRNVVGQQLLFLVVAVLAAWQEAVPLPVGRLDPTALAAALGLLVGGALLARPYWLRKVAEGDPRLALFAPRTAEERRWWVAVSLAAGISEEIVWRGVLVTLLWWLTGSWLTGALVSSVMFGVAHSLQGWRSAALIAVIAFGMTLFVRWADGLLLAAVMHAGYDVVAGFSYGKMTEGRTIERPMTED